jgi:LCP family protein required for cell wall assembly
MGMTNQSGGPWNPQNGPNKSGGKRGSAQPGKGARQPRPFADGLGSELRTMPTSTPLPRPRKRSPWKTVAGVVALSAIGAFAYTSGKLLSTANRLGGGRGIKSFINSYTNPKGEFPGKPDRITILLLGIDYSYLRSKDPKLNGAQYTKDSRSDTIMLLTLDTENKKVSALSIPRDTWVTDAGGHRGKINGAYKRGGPENTAKTVEKLLGVKPDYYIAIKPKAVKSLVDALGGVNVETIDFMRYDDSQAQLHIDLPKGPQTINGEQAIGFARFREADMVKRDENGKPIFTGRSDSEGNPIFERKRPSEVVHSKEESDPRRMARQQQLIRAVVEKGKQPQNLFRADKILESTMEHIQTDLSNQQLLALVVLFKEIKPDQIQSDTLQGEGFQPRGGTYRFVPDERKMKAMVDWLVKGDEAAANRLTIVAVQNGTDVHGLAARVAEQLQKEGFEAKSDGNAPREPGSEVVQTRIVYAKAAHLPRVEKIRGLIGGGEPVKEPRPDMQGADGYKHELPDVTIILGRDLAGTARSSEVRPAETTAQNAPL